jgi:hypothetical protein
VIPHTTGAESRPVRAGTAGGKRSTGWTWSRNHIGGVEPAAEADLHDRHIHVLLLEDVEAEHREKVEVVQVYRVLGHGRRHRVVHRPEVSGKRLLVEHAPVDANALAHIHEVWRREQPRPHAGRAQQALCQSRRRPLALGSRNVDRRQATKVDTEHAAHSADMVQCGSALPRPPRHDVAAQRPRRLLVPALWLHQRRGEGFVLVRASFSVTHQVGRLTRLTIRLRRRA